ncbi:MAG TPA: glycosyltransferase family 4 protein [Solirubrobacteraceae bacterium]|nr:glycosyltransferase family 4 protein [Solirubrobacteraceae bacterium]
MLSRIARLLFLTHEPPCPPTGGARLRNLHLMRELARRGHAVSLLTLVLEEGLPDAARAELAGLCERVEALPFAVGPARRRARLAADFALGRPYHRRYFLDRAARGAVRRLAADLRPDALVVAQLYMDVYAREVAAVPAVLDSHNVEERRVASMAAAGGPRALMARRQVGPVARYERAAVARAARTWAVSDEERLHFERAAPGRVDLVPNGVDATAVRMRPAPAPGADVLFLGRMDYGPNADGARHLIEDVLPLVRDPRVVVRVVGTSPPAALTRLAERASRPVEVTGFVPETAPYLAGARMLAVSLRSGGGTRLKILEALAAGVPVVTTSLGGEGIGLRDGHDALVADDPASFAAAIDRLAADDALCARLAANGRALVERRFDWSAVGDAAERSLAAVLSGRPGP